MAEQPTSFAQQEILAPLGLTIRRAYLCRKKRFLGAWSTYTRRELLNPLSGRDPKQSGAKCKSPPMGQGQYDTATIKLSQQEFTSAKLLQRSRERSKDATTCWPSGVSISTVASVKVGLDASYSCQTMKPVGREPPPLPPPVPIRVPSYLALWDSSVSPFSASRT